MSNMMKIENVPQYAEVEVLGISKSVAGGMINGSKERRQFRGRRILTLTAGFDPASTDANKPAAMIAKGDGTRLLQTVEKKDKFAVRISLGDGFKSRELEFNNVLVCTDTKDNPGSKIVFIHDSEDRDDHDNGAVLNKIAEFAPKMVEAHPDSFGDWELVDANAARVFVYFYTDVDAETGKGVPQD